MVVGRDGWVQIGGKIGEGSVTCSTVWLSGRYWNTGLNRSEIGCCRGMQSGRKEGRIHRADEVRVIEVSSTAVVRAEELGVQQYLDASLKFGIVDVDSSEFVDGSVVRSHAKWDGMAKAEVGSGMIIPEVHVGGCYGE